MDIDVIPTDQPNLQGAPDDGPVYDPMFSADPLVRIEAKLDALIDLLQGVNTGMKDAMEQLSDSPLGKMLGKMLGA